MRCLKKFNPAMFAVVTFAMLLSGIATASGNYILNGSQLTYESSNTLRVGYGTVVIGGTSYTPAGTWSGSFENTTCIVDCNLCPNSAYYMYYSGANGLVASVTPPYEDGYPQADLHTQNSNCNLDPAGDLVFLGSFITDASANIVPFERSGEDVIMTFTLAPSYNFTLQPPDLWATTYPTWVVPLTSTSMITDVDIASHDVSYDHQLWIVDNLGTYPTSAQCASGVPPTGNDALFYTYPSQTGGVAFLRSRMTLPVFTTYSAPWIQTAACDPNWGTHSYVEVTYTYVGYKEPVSHLNATR